MGDLIQLKAQAVVLIGHLDDALSVTRGLWLASPERSPECVRFYGKINDLLDQRLNLMRIRDSAPLEAQPPEAA